MKFFIIIGVGVCFVAAFVFLVVTQRRVDAGQAVISKTIISVEIAATEITRTKGLGGRESLSDDAGMVFKFPVAAKHSIWMKDMNFGIDIIWARNGKIVDIAPRVPPPGPDGLLKIYRPRLEADTIIEVVSGFTEDHDIRIGDPVEVRDN